MVDIHVYAGSKGYRTYITRGHKTTVIDGLFENPYKGTRTTRFVTSYMYGD